MHEYIQLIPRLKRVENAPCPSCTQLELHIQSEFNVMQDLVGRLTLDEMVAQMSHGGASNNGTNQSLIMMFRKF